MIGSNIFITNKFSFGNLITKLIKEFKARVAADGGTFEAESCLKTTLESLNLTYPVTFISSPVISGSTSVGSTITTTNGVVNGITPITYTYQWLLNGNPISGAINATYTTTNIGTLTCIVTGTNIYGAVSQVSNSLNIVFDADYQAVLDYATAQGYTLPSNSQKALQNQLLINLKATGIWAKLDTFSVFATDGSSDFALIDWKRLTQYTAVNSPTFATNQGYLTNGTSSYINTNFSPRNNGVNFQKDSASFGYYILTNINNLTSNVVGGGRDNLNNVTYELTDTKVFLNSSTAITDLPVNNSIGFRHLNRNSSSNITRYVNGVGETANNTSDNTLISNFYLGASSLNNVASGFESNKFAIFFIGGDLSAESSAFNTAVQTYISSL